MSVTTINRLAAPTHHAGRCYCPMFTPGHEPGFRSIEYACHGDIHRPHAPSTCPACEGYRKTLDAAPAYRVEHDIPEDAVTQVSGRDMNTLLRLGDVDITLSPAGAKALLTQLQDNAPQECAVCFGHRFTDGSRTIECTWCSGTGYTR